MYDVKAIANYFIDRGLNENIEISPMKLQKLLFFAYGLYLTGKGEQLFSDRFEVWPYGPVLSQLYHQLKGYGSNPIRNFVPDFDMASGEEFVQTVDKDDKEVNDFLNGFWNTYKGYTATQLSNATHLEGTPWKKAFDNQEKVISDKYIDEYFRNLTKN